MEKGFSLFCTFLKMNIGPGERILRHPNPHTGRVDDSFPALDFLKRMHPVPVRVPEADGSGLVLAGYQKK
jgi:hypothetical protein